MEETNNDIITIKGEEGEEYKLQVHDFIELDGKSYAILVSVDDEENDGTTDENTEECDTFIFRVEKDEQGEDILVVIEDEEEFNKVVEQLELSIE